LRIIVHIRNKKDFFWFRTFWFLLIFVFFCFLVVYLVSEGLLELGWAIFLMGYFLFLIILDFIWFAPIIRGIWIHRPRDYWKYRKYYNYLSDIKDSRKRRLVREIMEKKIAFSILMLLYFIIMTGWTFSKKVIALAAFEICFEIILIIGMIWYYYDFTRGAKEEKKTHSIKKVRKYL
jgi:hypothetical protein